MADLPTPELLTPRQLEVLELMAKGLTNREIAGVLDISAATVKVHVSAIIKALDVSNRTEAAMALQALGAGREASADEIPGFGGRPSLAVLPFDHFSDDPEQALFADGLVEDLTTRLAAWRWFPVIARNSAFAAGRGPFVVTDVARELGARYVIEGSTRRAGDRVRIHVQLIDGGTGAHVFARKVDRTVDDVFAAQDEIVEAIVGALEPTLLQVEGLRALRRPAHSLTTWEHVQRGLILLQEQLPEPLDRALADFDAAIAAEPDFAPAHAGRAMAQFSRGVVQIGATHWSEATEADMAAAFERAGACFAETLASGRRATECDPLDSSAWLALGAGLASTGQGDAARGALERAVDLGPSSAIACWGLASLWLATDRWRDARELYERAIRLSPRDPYLHHFEGGLAAWHLYDGDDAQALAWARRSYEHEPAAGLSYRPLIPASLARLGREEEARRECEAFRTVAPHWNLGLARALAPSGLVERLLEGIRLAGWDVEG
jgi:TolB-like protein/Flp pilus assembly protein TadD